MKKALKILGIIVAVAAIAYVVCEIIQFIIQYKKTKDGLEETASKQIFSKKKKRKEIVEETLNNNIKLFEESMVAHGAKLMEEFDEENRDKFELRPIYEYKGNYFRMGFLVFDEGEDPYIIVNAIDNEKFAKIGIMEEIEAYPYDMTAERINEVVGEFLETEL
ncbi:MAG: hypothetical protein K5639_01375 [Eubacterium sp.]|nr:hypothetical protein [Eubacterium sp.]